MIRTALRTRALIAMFATIVAGCSGGSGSPTTVPQTSSAPGAPPSAAKRASVSFTMHWKAKSASGNRHRTYVPSTAQSVTVSINGGQTQYLNNPATTLTIAAPPGVDNFAFATYDEQNGEGNVLSSATVTQTVVAGTGNFVSATLNAVIASIGVSLANAALPAGTAATTVVNVTALDADGNVIVGPGQYDTPIHLAVSDPTNSGTLSLSTNLLQAPGTPATITLNYSGGTLASGLPGSPVSTVVASASGLSSASAAFTPTPTIYPVTPYANQITVGGIIAGPDGNMWVTDTSKDSVDQITPAGVLTPFALAHASAPPQNIIAASDGNLWFAEPSTSGFGQSYIASMTTTGALTEYPFSGKEQPTLLADGGNGYIYYTDANFAIGYQQMGVSSPTNFEAKVQSKPSGVVAGTDHNLYIPIQGAYERIPIGMPTSAPLTEIGTGGDLTGNVVVGPDGNIWFPDLDNDSIDVLSQSTFSIIHTYLVPTPQSQPNTITVGKDGALWFTEYASPKIGRITTNGLFSEYSAPYTNDAGVQNIVSSAPDGSIWFATLYGPEKLVY